MQRQPIIALFFTAILFLFTTVPALAGGWAIVVLDEVPQSLAAGETIALGFSVRQHGVDPINLENVVLTATGPEGESLTFLARQEGAEGHYLVDVTLPSAGVWAWQIQPDWFKATDLAAITVSGAPAVAPAQPNPSLAQLVTRIGAWVLNWWVGVDTLLGATSQPTVAQPVNAATSHATQGTTDAAAYGRAIFMAKGCNTCHLHGAALNTASIGVGPDLTGYQLPAAYLRLWLKDPQAVKPATAMPNLALTTNEIEALITFLPSSAQ